MDAREAKPASRQTREALQRQSETLRDPRCQVQLPRAEQDVQSLLHLFSDIAVTARFYKAWQLDFENTRKSGLSFLIILLVKVTLKYSLIFTGF